MAETPPIRKFMFDRSFDGAMPANNIPAERKPVTLKPEQLDALKQESHDAGYTAGCQVAADQHAQQLGLLLGAVEKNIAFLMEHMQDLYRQQDTQVRDTVLAIAKKILPEFTARYGLQEIQKIISDSIGEMLHEPRLVVRVHQDQFDAINDHVNTITVQKAYAGKVVVLSDEQIAFGDCRVEWADGGLERNTQVIWDSVEKIVAPEATPLPHQE